jgi:hypothetical protein
LRSTPPELPEGISQKYVATLIPSNGPAMRPRKRGSAPACSKSLG